MKKNTLNKAEVGTWMNFYDKSFYWPYLLDYRNSIAALTDLSPLWFREFYLEMSRVVQIPIAMSMPWILTDFVIKTPSIKENIFFVLDIYNDAASHALDDLNQQFLYEEIEAEVNLAFDQLIYLLSEEVFKHYKTLAAHQLVDKYLAANYPFDSDAPFIPSRLETLAQQRHVQLLGRTLDMNALITQYVDRNLRQNLAYVIARFESGDVTGVIELEALLANVLRTHQLLGEHLVLDSYESMFAEANENFAVGVFRSRLVMHMFSELASDLLPNFVYCSATGRFVRGPASFKEQVERAPAPRRVPSYFWYGRRHRAAYDAAMRLSRGYFGAAHVEAMLRVLDYADVPLLSEECLGQVEYLVAKVLKPYSKVVLDALPPLKLPKIQYGVVGAYGLFDLKLAPVAKYALLRSAVFQSLREIGNTLIFLQMLDQATARRNDQAFVFDAFFHGIMPLPGADTHQPFVVPSATEAPVARIARKAAKTLASELPAPAKHAIDAAVELMARGAQQTAYDVGHSSLLSGALQRLSGVLDAAVRDDWTGYVAPNGILDVETPFDFCRFWSALQFIYVQNASDGVDKEVSDVASFGDGFSWAGCALLHLMGFRERFELLDFSYHVGSGESLTHCLYVKSLRVPFNCIAPISRFILLYISSFLSLPPTRTGSEDPGHRTDCDDGRPERREKGRNDAESKADY
jgi:cytoplasmic FMR1 interacting protein